MIRDIRTVILKEWKEYLQQRGSMKGTILMLFIPALILGIIFPLQTGLMWLESPLSLAAWAWVPLLMVMSMIADSFAGERERHTLETLLASRLSDSTILLGKILSAVLYALVITVIIIILGLITVNIANPLGGLHFYPVRYLVPGAVLSILVAWLASGIGVLVSLRSSTVRQAQQTLSFGIIIFAFLPGLILPLLPDTAKDDLAVFFETVGTTRSFLLFLLFLLVINILLLKASLMRFRRTRLILD